MIIVLILMALCPVIYLVTVCLDYVGNRWRRLPQFVYNYVGGVFAICSITDYEKALSDKRIRESIAPIPKTDEEKYIRVSQTIVFGSGLEPIDMRKRFSGRYRWEISAPWPVDGYFYPAIKREELFVPFASERCIPFSEQEHFFVGSRNPDDFQKSKRIQNRKSNFRLRFAEWERVLEMDALRFFSGLISVVIISMVTAIAGMWGSFREDTRKIVLHVSAEDGSVLTVTTPTANPHWLLMGEDLQVIVRGHVWKIQPLGSGLSRACIMRADKSFRCGFASQKLNIKEGDEAYVRDGQPLWWSYSSKFSGQRTGDSWFISKTDAENLVLASGFRIIN